MKTIQQLEAERLEWSKKTFGEATPISSIRKLESELKEVEQHLEVLAFDRNQTELTEEYADCLMCLFDSAGRVDILPDDIFDAFAKKLEKNKSRKWVKNIDNSYSHIK